MFSGIVRKHRKTQKQFLKYVFVGGITQLVDLISYSLFVFLGVQYLIAGTINNPFVWGVNFLGHKYITFDTKQFSHKEIGGYILTFFINYVYAISMLFLLVDIFSVNEYVAKLIQMGTVPFFNFFLLKKLVFKQ